MLALLAGSPVCRTSAVERSSSHDLKDIGLRTVLVLTVFVNLFSFRKLFLGFLVFCSV